jgi:diguanylate cyclase (GGDEF)-like protein/PAS domain S-box-containing protein
VWLSVSARPVRPEAGMPCAVVAVIRSLGATSAASAAIVQLEHSRAAILEALQEGVVVTGVDGAVVAANSRAAELIGVSVDGDGRLRLSTPGLRRLRADGTELPPEEYASASAARTGKPVLGVVQLVERPDGQRRWLSISATPTVIQGRSVVVGSFLDITDRHVDQLARHDSELRLRITLDSIVEGVVFYGRDGRAVAVNPAAQRILGIEPEIEDVSETVRGRAMIRPDGDLIAFETSLQQSRMHGIDLAPGVFGLVGAGGTLQWLRGSVRVVHDAPDEPPYALVTSFADITDTVLQARALAEAEERLRTIFDQAPIGIALIEDGQILQANQAWAEILGYSIGQLRGRSIAEITHPDDRADFAAPGRETDGSGQQRGEKRYMHADGHAIWVQLDLSIVRSQDGAVRYTVAQIQDITDRRRQAEQLEHLADHDPLSGLLNRRGFQRALDGHVWHAERYGADGALLMLDLDHFKEINDTLGHMAGDALIVEVAETLTARLRRSDIVARLGGDEFAILLPHGDRHAASSIADSLLSGLRERATSDVASSHRPNCRLTASMGIAMCEPGATSDSLLIEADVALYDAKRRGRDGWSIDPRSSPGTHRQR